MFCRKALFQLQKSGYATKATVKTVTKTVTETAAKATAKTTTKTAIKRKTWTNEETELLKSLVAKYGKQWSMLSMYFEDRSSNTLASHHFYMEKQKLKELGNHKKWSTEEDEALLFQVDKTGLDWKRISNEFQGRRTEKELSDRFSTLTKNSKYNHGIWSKGELQTLNRLIVIHKKNWQKISNALGTRSANQCYSRWKKSGLYVVNPDDKLALKEEDAKNVIELVKLHGLDFKLIQEKLGLSRISPEKLEQIYRTELDPAICRDPWTEDELHLLVEMYRELDGSMKLIQTCLPKKRTLTDLWEQYHKATHVV